MDSPWQALQRRTRETGAAPLITWYGDGGLRAELSVVTFATAVAKTAASLTSWDVPIGATVRLDLPLHWQVPVWLGACDLAGLTVVDSGAADVVATAEPGRWSPDASADPPPWGVVVSVDPFGLPGAPVPPPLWDHARESMGQPDRYLDPPAADSWWATSSGRWDRNAIVSHADGFGVGPADRLIVTPDTPDPLRWLAAWAVPVVTGATVVLCDTPDPTPVISAEAVTGRLEP